LEREHDVPRLTGLERLRRLIGGNVAVAATACLAPLLVLVGELTDHSPPPAKAAQLQMAAPPAPGPFAAPQKLKIKNI
jgi:hypothetical protein